MSTQIINNENGFQGDNFLKFNELVSDDPCFVDKIKIKDEFFSKTFCVLPWISTFIDVNGEVKLCCISSEGLKVNNKGILHNIQLKPHCKIWNSDEMKTARRKMIEGKKVIGCNQCYNEDDAGQTSLRKLHNLRWFIENRERKIWFSRVQNSVKNNFSVNEPPINYDLRPGNICTLKCRMCHSGYSNLIQNDPVHSKWAPSLSGPQKTRFPDDVKWFGRHSIFFDELMDNIKDVRSFYFAGGEPLINPFITRVIDYLVANSLSKNINLEFSTNLTVFNDALFEKLQNFEFVNFFISVDGFGEIYEYIRYPGKWSVIKQNMEKISQMPFFKSRLTVTVQNYNALYITDLLEFAESLQLPVTLNMVYGPEYLNVKVMPRNARLLAAERLKIFVNKSKIAKIDTGMKATINNVVLELENEIDNDSLYQQQIENFISFTNSLDKSRNQDFKKTFPELFRLITDGSFVWNDDLDYNTSELSSTENVIDDNRVLNLELLVKKLKLDNEIAIKVNDILSKAKDKFVQVCSAAPVDNSDSPIIYAAKILADSRKLDKNTFMSRLITYLTEKIDPVSNNSYLEVASLIDKSIDNELKNILPANELKILNSLHIGSLLLFNTGYDPFLEKINQTNINKND